MPPKKLDLNSKDEGEEDGEEDDEDLTVVKTVAAKKKAAKIKKEEDAAQQALQTNTEEAQPQAKTEERALAVISDHVEDTKNQNKRLQGLEAQLVAISARVQEIEQGKKNAGPTIPKGPIYQYHEVVRKLVASKHLDPNNKDIIPFVTKIHYAGKHAENVARIRDAEEAMESLRTMLDEMKGSLLSMQLTQKQKGPRSGTNDAMGTLNRADISKVTNQLRGHIKNTVMEILLAQEDPKDNEEDEAKAPALDQPQKRPFQAEQGLPVAAPKKKPRKAAAATSMATPIKKEDKPPPGMGGDHSELPTMETPPPKVERWEATEAEYKIVEGEFESVNVEEEDLSTLTYGTYHAIRCGLFSPGYLASELKKVADAEEDELHTVVGRVKAWSHKIATHHGHSNPKGSKGGTKRGVRGGGRGRGRDRY